MNSGSPNKIPAETHLTKSRSPPLLAQLAVGALRHVPRPTINEGAKMIEAVLRNRMIIGLFAASWSITGCATFEVKSKVIGTDATESGILYYPPKPYLLVTQNVNVAQPKAPEPKKEEKQKEEKGGEESGFAESNSSSLSEINLNGLLRTPQYGIQVIYLPDLARPQRVHMNAGIGTVDTTFGMADGWQLSALNVKLNSQVPETIGAIGEAAGSIAGLIPTPAAAGEGASRLETLVQLLQTVTAAGSQESFTDDKTKQASVQKVIDKILALLDALPQQLKPRVWIYEIVVSDDGAITFELIKNFGPFRFEQ